MYVNFLILYIQFISIGNTALKFYFISATKMQILAKLILSNTMNQNLNPSFMKVPLNKEQDN